uniref:RTX toxins and related Ca2+-binding proteins n=1 Tax=Magnetospirillum gryphiswaldense TaxID=55518 RepID=A4TXL1_9PROT|nr:RTX toxins and related Ca2+-binding proteins [Magnetospirillum gryphiswaldense MSR-1]
MVSDANGDGLSLAGPVTADHGSVTDNLDGTFTLTPDADFHGPMVISYGVSDGSVTITATTLANFANTPDAPVAGSVTLPATSEDTGLVLSLAQLLGSATDADGDPLAITNLSASNGAGFTDNGNGTFTITPAANYSGTVSLTYDIDDGTGNLVATSASVTVNAANDAPTMSSYVGMSSPNEDGPFPGETVYALFNTGFSDTADLGTLAGVAVIGNNTVSPDGAWQYSSDGGTTWVDVGGVNDNSSALALSASTKLRFNAAPDFHGTAPSLYVRGLDNSYAGGWSSSTGSAVYTNTSSPGGSSAIAAAATELSTDVNAVNDAPTSSAVTLTAGVENVLYTFTETQLLANAVDVDGDTLTISSVTPSTGTVTNLGGGNYSWALPADYNGTASLTYIIGDGQGGTVTGSADVSIAAMVTTAGVDTLTAGDGDNAYRVDAGTFAAGDSIIDTGNPADADVIRVISAGTVDLAAGSVTGIESIAVEASGATTIVLGGGADPQQFQFIGGGPGSDTVQLADSGSTLDLTGIVLTSIDSVSTGAGNDTISFDDVNFPSIGIVVDGDASAVDSDKVIIYQTQAGTLDVSASVFSNIETVALVAATSSDVVLIGNSLNNSLVGGAGSDKLTGGTGADTLTGGAGSDVFVYTTPTESANALANRDTITDFTSGTDHIHISVSGAHVDVSGFESVGSYNLGQASLTGGVARTGGVIGDCFYAGGVDQALYVWVGNSSSNINTDGGYVIASPTAIAAADLDFNISGTAGTDTLVGGAGNDTLIASLGGDSLTGNAGTDSFVLADNSNTTITDFTVGTDTVTLSNTEFALGSSGTLAVSDYAEGATAMSGTAFDYGATGDGLVAIQSGADVQLWSTTAMEAATTANSVLVGTLNNVNTSALDNTSFHLGV